jgi:transposase
VTVIVDKGEGRVLAVIPDRKAETVSLWFKNQEACDFSELESIWMDMSEGYIKAVRKNFERWEELICFDRFHVPQHFNKGLDRVRRKEQRELEDGGGKSVVNGRRADNRERKRRKFNPLTRLHIRTARA